MSKTSEQNRLVIDLAKAEMKDIVDIVAAAIRLEKAMYSAWRDVDGINKCSKYLFELRKALEGIWGHDPGPPDV